MTRRTKICNVALFTNKQRQLVLASIVLVPLAIVASSLREMTKLAAALN